MADKYILVRMRREDYDRMVNTKKLPIEQDLKNITGKTFKLSNPQLFKIASISTWDLGAEFQNKLVKSVKLKRGGFKL